MDPCPTATINGAAVTNQNYNIYYPTIVLSLTAFTSTETSSICGNFVYSCTYGDGTSIDTSVFTFSTSPFQFSI